LKPFLDYKFTRFKSEEQILKKEVKIQNWSQFPFLIAISFLT